MPTKDEARKRRVEAAQKSGGIKLCSECQLLIENPRPGQVAHIGECGRARQLRLKREKAIANWKPPEVITKTCECGIVFETTDKVRVYCGTQPCFNARQNAKNRRRRARMAPEEKKAYNQQKYETDKPAKEKFKKPRKRVECRCPGCRKLHTVNFEYGYSGEDETPWKGCKKYPDCAHPGVDKSLFGYEGARFSSA